MSLKSGYYAWNEPCLKNRPKIKYNFPPMNTSPIKSYINSILYKFVKGQLIDKKVLDLVISELKKMF